jgi:hypothetical protein
VPRGGSLNSEPWPWTHTHTEKPRARVHTHTHTHPHTHVQRYIKSATPLVSESELVSTTKAMAEFVKGVHSHAYLEGLQLPEDV